jgi:hypothetical protein
MLLKQLLQKRFKVWLLFSFILSVSIYSCTKFDISLQSTALHDADFSEKFFQSKSQPTPQVAAIIEKLKRENNRTGFILKLPANCGLPVWDKLAFPKKTSSQSFGEVYTDDNIIIPLTSNGYSVSTVITATLTDDTEYSLKWYTATDLYNVCYAMDKDVKKAESLLALFITIVRLK